MPKSKEFVSDSDDDSVKEEQPRKKQKTEPQKDLKKTDKTLAAVSSDATAKASKDGEAMFSLGKKKFATVSEFRGGKFVNIREYYDADGTLKPGKKGIALSIEQWNKLKEMSSAIDSALDEM